MEENKKVKKETYEIVVKSGEKDYKCTLREPSFQVYCGALLAMQTASGNMDRIQGGKFVIQTCWIEGDDEMKNEEFPKIFISACLDAISLVDIYNSEIKKK